MITTKADKLLRSLIDAGLSLTEFTILATKILRIQRNFKVDYEDRRQRDHRRQQTKLREQNQLEQQLKQEEQRRTEGLNKLRQFGYLTNEEIPTNPLTESLDQIKTDQFVFPFSKEINNFKQKQRDCCLTFNIDYDLRRNQQTLERACKRAKRNIYELRAERFNRPESRSILSVETITLYSKLKEAIREINKIFTESKSDQDKRYLQELLTYINQFEGDIDLLMCQMQYEPKAKETILFSPVTTDILDRMNLILHQVRTLAHQISTGDYLDENLEEETNQDQPNIPNKATYIIKIKTNDQISSSLSDETNVSIKLHGTYNKSPDVRLLQSINKIKWQSGQIDLFNIELNYLGDLYAIEIWHDSQYSSWKVDWIEIIDDAANIYRFPLDRLFDKYSDEKKTRFMIQRDIGPVNRLPTKPIKEIKPYNQIGFATYTVQVKTGKQPNKVTDSSIFMQLKGENGSFSDQLCSANSAFKSSVFEPDQLDTFYLVWPHLAKLNSLHLLVQSEGVHPSWFCEYITVEDGQTGEKYKFIVKQLFDGSNPADPNLKRHLTVSPENTDKQEVKEVDKEKPGYLMKIKTGEKGLSNMSTLPPINLILKGEKGKSEPYTLKSLDNQRKLFQENQTDQFAIPPKYYIGSIKNLQLSSNDQLDKWFIENIIIRDIAQGKDYVFPLYKWFSNQDGASTLTAQPINERKANYKVYTRTIASELKGPDRSIKLLLQGSNGKQEVELNNPITMANTFQPGRKDEFYLENITSLGDLQSIQVDVTHPNIKKLGLDYIEIKDLTTNDSYRFNINRMLDSKNPKMVSKAEVIPRSAANPTSSKPSSNPPTSSNRPNFDQITKNVPQGAKRSDNKSKVAVKVDEEFEEENLNIIDDKSISMEENSSEIDRNNEKYELLDKTSRKDGYQSKIKITDEDGQSISDQRNTSLQKGKTDSFTDNVPKDFEEFKDVKLSAPESKSQQKYLYQPDNNKTHRREYTKDTLLNAEEDRLPSTKPYSDTSIREQTRPQGTAPSSSFVSNKSPHPQLADRSLLENDDEDFSLTNQTITSSTSENLSKELNSISEKTSNRQIRPGDRVKNNIKKLFIDHQSKSSLHEADWYRRSIETNEDHRNEPKQIQLISNKHLSQTKFDQRQAEFRRNKDHDENQRIDRQLSKEKKENLLPKKSSSRSLKQQTTGRAISKLPSNKQEYANESSTELIDVNNRTDSRKIDKVFNPQRSAINQRQNSDQLIQENYSMPVIEQQKVKESSKPTTRFSSGAKQMPPTTITDEPTDSVAVMESRTPSNVSELTKPYIVSDEQSKTAIRTSTEHRDTSLSNKQRTEIQSPPSKHEQKGVTSSIYNPLSNQSLSTPPQSRTSTDTPKRRSQSASSSRAPSNIPSTISKDQSEQLSKIYSPSTKSSQMSHPNNPSATDAHSSHLASKTSLNSTHQFNQTPMENKTATDSSALSTTEKSSQRPQVNITDSTFNEYHLQGNTQNISSVTIHTIATKSDSDVHSIRKSMDDHESEYSLENKSLLSPNTVKKSRKTSGQHTTKTSSHKPPSNIPSDDKLNHPISSTNDKYLSKETSDIQYASLPTSSRSPSTHPPIPIEFKVSETQNERVDEYQDQISKQSQSYTNEPVISKPSSSHGTRSKQSSIESHSTPSNISTKTGQSTISTQNPSLSQGLSTGQHSIASINPSISSNLSTKLTEVNHMSTVYEESEPSTNSIPPIGSPSLHQHDSTPVNQQNRLERNSNPSSSQPNLQRNHKSKTSSKEKSLSNLLSKSSRGSNHHKKTIDAKTILTSVQSNTSIAYEFRVQTGNESQLDGTNEHVAIELISKKGQSLKISLVNSINNPKPFQKGQLDIFHLNIPNNFHNIKKINLALPRTTKDPLHIRYCELQDRQTMNTLYFPIEQWLGENNIYDVEMHLKESLF